MKTFTKQSHFGNFYIIIKHVLPSENMYINRQVLFFYMSKQKVLGDKI